MGLSIVADEAKPISEGVWAIELPPHQVRMLGDAPSADGAWSILMLRDASFDGERLQFDANDVRCLNVGTSPHALVISDASISVQIGSFEGIPKNAIPTARGPGDREFLSLAKRELPQHMYEAALSLLEGVRDKSAGDLKRGLSKNFSETPDNFWYVIIQPRIEQLSITVRGPVEHFRKMARLPIKDDRGNTLFKVESLNDVPAAVELIFHAIRKPSRVRAS